MKRQQVEYWDSYIYWYFNKKLHRDRDLPSQYYFSNRKLIAAYYSQHGKVHRTTGPAAIHYDTKIKIYFYQNRQYDSFEEMLMVETCR